jgi:hypothetical protein
VCIVKKNMDDNAPALVIDLVTIARRIDNVETQTDIVLDDDYKP